MTETGGYGYEDFISDCEMITAVEKEWGEIIRKISRRMKLLLAGADFLTEEERRPDPRHYARHLVHLDRKRRFVVLAGVWLPGQGTPVHDHGTWGIMGLFQGELQVTNYLRLDDRTKEGHAKLRPSTGFWAGRGSISYVLPPNEEIHKVENSGGQTALSLHVYGRDIIECNMYDLEKESVRPYAVEIDSVATR